MPAPLPPAEVPPALDTPTRLAYSRTFLAYESAQMAWVRTCLSLISFGFTIVKFVEFLRERDGSHNRLLGSELLGVMMMTVGLGMLLIASLQHMRSLRLLRAECPNLPTSLAGLSTLLIAILGIAAEAIALLHQ